MLGDLTLPIGACELTYVGACNVLGEWGNQTPPPLISPWPFFLIGHIGVMGSLGHWSWNLVPSSSKPVWLLPFLCHGTWEVPFKDDAMGFSLALVRRNWGFIQ